MVELFKFRCYQCQKLIGAPPSRFGKVVKCPKCGVDLVVPSPDEGDDEGQDQADPDAVRLEDLGLRIEPERISAPSTAPPAPPVEVGPDPIAFLQRATEDPPEGSETGSEAEGGSGDFDPSDLPEPAVEPLVRRPRNGRSAYPVGASPRARDVVIPRTAAVAWALFALLGLAFAFTSGLFVGQRLGK